MFFLKSSLIFERLQHLGKHKMVKNCTPKNFSEFFFAFTRGNNLVTSCFLSMAMQTFQIRVSSLRQEFAPRGANSFL